RLVSAAEQARLDRDAIAAVDLPPGNRSRAQAGKWTDPRARPDRRPFEIGERADPRSLPDRDTRAKGDVRLDDNIAAEPRVGAEEHRLRRDQGHSPIHRHAA